MVSSELQQQLGVDVSRQWQQYEGDLVLVDGTDNVYQALFNRLTCRYGDMAYFYSDYGSKIFEWLCTPSYQQNLDLLADEVCHRILEDPRISKCDVNIEKINPYLVNIKCECVIKGNSNFSGNFVLNAMNNQLYYSGSEETYMQLTLGRWTCDLKNIPIKEVRVGDSINILCRVTNKFDEGIPIGQVDFYLGTHFIQTVDLVKGYADLKYTIPTFTPIGTHEITAHFRGIGRFSSCRQTVTVKIVNKYTTITKYMNNPIYGVSGGEICLPTSVKDINGGNVTEGEVYHYLNVTDLYKINTILNIEDVYKTVGDPSCVLHNATLIDGWGDPVECGLVNFYIGNGLGVLRATRSIIDNTFTTTHEPQRGLYNAKVTDEKGSNVFYGDFVWYLRKYHGGLNTITNLPDSQTMYKGFNDCIFAELTDEDGIPVHDGEFDFYIRCLRMCKPWFSKTVLDYASTLEGNMDTYLSALVTDADNFIVDGGDVDFSIDDSMIMVDDPNTSLAMDLTGLPISFNSNVSDLSSPYMRAMITDENGVVIDVGEVITEETSNGRVSTYVSSDNVEEDGDMIEFSIRGNGTNG